MALVHRSVDVGAFDRGSAFDFEESGLVAVEGSQDEGSVEEEMLLELMDAVEETEKGKS